MSLVSFVRVHDAGYASLKEGIKASLNLIHFDFNRSPENIVIKPNMCYYHHPSTGEVTDPSFVAALIDVLRENLARAGKISIVESDASAMECKKAFHILEYDKMAEEKDVEMINLSETRSRAIETLIDGSKFTFQVPELFYEAGLIVNVPKPKYMGGPKISCALKNFYGCNAYPRKLIYHRVLHDAIVFMNKQIKTDLVVFDGLVVAGKHAKRLNMILSSQDPVAADAAAAELMQISPNTIKHLALASCQGIGSLNFTPIGDFSFFKKTYPAKKLKDNMRERIASLYLKIIRQ